jgi:glucose-1-phosphate thymidylyltransferase
MAGMGKRMRPHTLTLPKPLISIAGKSIVQRLVEDIVKVSNETVEEIAFIVGDFGKEVEEKLIHIATKLGAEAKIYYQHQPLGTAHALLCAAPSLEGKITVAYADTLFKADFTLNEKEDGVIWVHKVNNPEQFGVVKLDAQNYIIDFIEKPQNFISDLAIVGIYYFKDGAYLRSEIQFLVDNNISKNDEYQLTDALQNMMKKGTRFAIDRVNEWLDCGNKDATVFTNQRILELAQMGNQVAENAKIINSIIIPPCFISRETEIVNSIIGPHVSVEKNTFISHSIVTNSIIESHSHILNANIDNSMIGNFVEYSGEISDVSIGDYTTIKKTSNA